ncbi:MAG TPA: SIMPL domain-containing protein, partial [Candidatus Baltobacteraceae bacterium]
LVGQARTNMATIAASVHHPTQAQLQNGMLTLSNTFASMPTLILNAVDVRLTADNCAAVQRKAEALAIAQARSRAAYLAQQIGAKLGPAVSIDEHDGGAFGGQGTCTSAYSVGPYGPPPIGLADMLTVKTFSNITMRFAIVRVK